MSCDGDGGRWESGKVFEFGELYPLNADCSSSLIGYRNCLALSKTG